MVLKLNNDLLRYHQKIFGVFQTLRKGQEQESTGIGLALVHQMTISMNGKIDVVNSDPGAEFSVQFPAV